MSVHHRRSRPARASAFAWNQAIAIVVAIAASAHVLGAQAQGSASGPTTSSRIVEIPIDRASGAIAGVLPFDEPFVLTGSASASLLRLKVWWVDSTAQSRDSCAAGYIDEAKKHSSAAGRDHMARKDSSAWVRRGTPTSFTLSVGELHPNRMYTFCIQSVESLSATDSAQFVARATNNIRRIVTSKEWIPSGKIVDTALRKLQVMLHGALPQGAVDIPDGSVLVAAPDSTTPSGKTARAHLDTLTFATFTAFKSHYEARDMAVRNVKAFAQTVPGRTHDVNEHVIHPELECLDSTSWRNGRFARDSTITWDQVCMATFGWLITRVAASPTLARLAAVDRVLGALPTRAPRGSGQSAATLPKALSDRLSDATILARRWTTLSTAMSAPQAAAVAYGTTSIVNMLYPVQGNANPEDVRSASEVSPWLVNLDTTIARIADLRELVAFASSDPLAVAALARAPTNLSARDSTQLKSLDSLLRATYAAATAQRTRVTLLAEVLSEQESDIHGVVSGLAARDLKQVGLIATTAANYEARARWYVGQDLGIVYGMRGDKVRQASPYLGLNIYLRPVNKRAPKPVVCIFDLRCTSLSIGVPTNNWEQENSFSGILGGRPLVVGVGTRIGDFLRIAYAPALVYSYTFSPNGERQRHLDAIAGVSVTLDTDLREIISGVAGAIFPK